MLGLFIMVIALIICIIVVALSIESTSDIGDVTLCVSLTATLLLIFIIITLSVTAVIFNANPEGQLAKMQFTRDILVYQLENNLYISDNNVGLRNLYERIESYNNAVISGRYWQNNIWWGFMTPDIYDQLELIDYTSVRGGEGP